MSSMYDGYGDMEEVEIYAGRPKEFLSMADLGTLALYGPGNEMYPDLAT